MPPEEKGDQQTLPGIKTESALAADDKSKKDDGGEAAKVLGDLIRSQKETITKLEAKLAKKDAPSPKGDDEAKQQIEFMKAELEATKAQMEKFQTAEKARAERMYKALPEATQKKLDGLADKLDVDVWVELLEREMNLGKKPDDDGGDDKKKILPPPIGSGRPRSDNAEDTYTPTERGADMMETYGISDEQIRKLRYGPSFGTDDDGESGRKKVFSNSVKDFIANMKRRDTPKISITNANRRRGE